MSRNGDLPDPSGPVAEGDVDVDGVQENIVSYYADDPVAFAEDPADRFGALGGGLGLTLADTQRRVLEAVREGHNQIIVVSGNGTGKTAVATIAAYWNYQTNFNSFTMLTSGNYDILLDTSNRFLRTIHKRGKAAGWHGNKKESPPMIEHPEYNQWFLRYMSPRDPKNLEGRHGRKNFVVIEEADKPDVTEQHFDSATSTHTEAEDVVIALANPPEDKANVVYDLLQSPNWHTIQFSSFDSHNVKRELGELEEGDDRGRIPGLRTLDLIKKRWSNWNRREWPGVEVARRTHPDFWGEDSEKYANLDPRWYRRVLGKMPPGGAATLRPYYERDVDAAVARWDESLDDPEQEKFVRAGLGMDVARGGGDRSVVIERRIDGVLQVAAGPITNIDDHQRNHDLADEAMERGPLDGWFWVDAIGEGSGVGDYVRRKYPGGKRFKASKEPEEKRDGDDYYNWKTWAFVQLGNALRDYLVVPPGTDLEEELRAGARVLTLEERNLRGGNVLQLRGKDDLKSRENLGRSPDLLDASSLACFEPRVRKDFEDPNVGGVVS